jgi:hypothetical protein
LALFLVSLAACSLCAQAPTNSEASNPVLAPPIKVETRVVLVDVVVTNQKGEAVANLHQQDFRIKEDGKPQTFSAFDEHKRDGPGYAARVTAERIHQ